ncbi:MAG: cysteine--tRNA ligase [Gammaproteobacteria bacterium]|nr:cysteine--tRNA ligase [Gammaproteobacteria bacterium]NNF62055.1 cysteine--tRNA ligase [Gammaproteobacteria bacterium]NNM20666.1 cysteine--tRNA ligase [Gammaproteobacteria bacterium]
MLQIYNSLTRAKESFTPLVEGQIRIYVCGITVYDYLHLGHARMMVVFDVITRHLRALGYDLQYVRNITDIDDKIINRANENGEDYRQLTARFIDAMHEDCAALNVLPPDEEPRATEHIDEIVAMISSLVAGGYAYAADNGDVYYAVEKYAPYGRLSDQDPAELRSGARIDVDEAKRDPLDFVLWKSAKPGEPAWDSPWGAGRPGWHIECSAMSTALLGNHFDIHGGGMDLKFPHHENEIAQSCAATGENFVNLWMHNGFVQVDDEKMSKSLGNFFTVRDILEHFHPEEVRNFILSGHYRSPINYSDKELTASRAALQRLYTALRGQPDTSPPQDEPYTTRFVTAMNDDFNTPEALAVLFDLARAVNRARDDGDEPRSAALAALLKKLGDRLGLLQADPEAYLQSGAGGSDLSDEQIEQAIAARRRARDEKQFADADRIRDELAAAGIVLEDSAAGTTWRRE